MKKFLLIFCLFFAFAQTKADTLTEEIDHLLLFVKNSDVIFIRNNKEYAASKALEHIHTKYNYFKKKITTAELFVQYCVTKSELSGKAYMIRKKDNTTISAADWLLAELKQFREQQKKTDSNNIEQ